MNKLLTKIVGAALGLTMTVGVGVAVVSNQSVSKANAAGSTETITLQESTFSGMGNNNYGSGTEYTGTVTSTSTSTSVSVGGHYITKNSGWQWQANNANVYNKTALPGRITQIVLTQTGTARAFTAFGGTEQLFSSTETGTGKSPSGTSLGNVSAAATMTWTAGSDTNYTYFAIHKGANAGKVTSVVVTFEVASVETYTVSFNANGGTGTMSDVSDVTGSYTLPANGFTAPNGKTFSGWKAGNAGDLIAAGASYNVSADVTFYAQWVNAYTVTYTAGTNGSGSYAHASQPAGTYTLLPFASLTGVSASSGYKFSSYTVGGVDKNPGDTITLSAATAVTVNFEVKPIETTYDFTTRFSTYASSWDNSYTDHTGLNGTTDIGGDYAATIDLHKASKQTATITTMPVFATKTSSGSWYQAVHFTLTETGYKIKEVQVTFAQWTTKTPDIALFKGNTVSGTPLDSGTIGTKNTISVSDLNGTDFSVGYCDKSTNNVQAGIQSIYISLEPLASFGTLDHISITALPNVVYHVGETFDPSGLAVTAFDGADESTANFKDVTANVETDLDDPTPFVDGDVPGFDCDVQYTGDGGTDTTSFHVYVYALAEYNLVTSDQEDWSGTYLIVSENHDSNLVAMNGGLTDPDIPEGYKVVTETAGSIEAGQELEWTIAKVSGGYSIQGKSGKYIGSLTGKSNGMLVSGTALVNTITYEDDAVSISGTNGYKLKIYNDTTTSRFRYYASGSVQLYKLAESDDVSDYADLFLDTLTGASGVCHYDEGTGEVTTVLSELKVAWKTLADEYSLLSHADQEQFRLGVASSEPGASNVARALYLYDHIATAYGTQLESEGLDNYNFMNRSITPLHGQVVTVSNSGTAAIISIIAVLSLSAVAGFFMLRKRKEQ